MDFRRFLAEYQLIVFEKNRDLFCQLLAPYQGSMHYVISSECPGVIYEEMDADFHMIKVWYHIVISIICGRKRFRITRFSVW